MFVLIYLYKHCHMERDPVTYWVETLGLKEHPEGGFYRETYRSAKRHEGRNLATNIFYLLPGDRFSRFHRLRYDEHWYFHCGATLKLYFLKEEGMLEEHLLGLHPDKGESPSLLVPERTIFGGEVTDKHSFTLVSCNMAPGFHFEDFEMYPNRELKRQFPQHTAIIDKLT